MCYATGPHNTVGGRNGHEACVRLLIAAGAKVNAASYDGATALFISAQKGREACAFAF